MKVKVTKTKDTISIERRNQVIGTVDLSGFENFLYSSYLDFKGFENIAYPKSKYKVLFKKINSSNEFIIINGRTNIIIKLEDFHEYFKDATTDIKEFEIIRKTRYGIPVN